MSRKSWFNFGRGEEPEAQEEKIATTDALSDMVPMIAENLQRALPTEQDNWWFLAEQYDKIVALDSGVPRLLGMFPLNMFPVEYEGRKSEESYVGSPNPGVVYLDGVRKVIGAQFGDGIADLTVSHAFILCVIHMQDQLNQIRLKYAVHFHNNCVQSKSYRHADEWHEVIVSLGGD